MDSGFGLKRQHEFPKRQNSGSYLVLFSESFGVFLLGEGGAGLIREGK